MARFVSFPLMAHGSWFHFVSHLGPPMTGDPWFLEAEQLDMEEMLRWERVGIDTDEMCATCERFSRPSEGCPACGVESVLDGPHRAALPSNTSTPERRDDGSERGFQA